MEQHRNTRARWLATTCAVTLGVTAIATAAGSAGPATVTRGELTPVAAGIGGTVSGHAQMVRDASGSTIVSLHVEGLTPGGTYASHVHAAPCAVSAADGHYKYDPTGPGPDLVRWCRGAGRVVLVVTVGRADRAWCGVDV